MTERVQPGFGRILVTGGAGFIGANLVRLLLSRGCQVTVMDNLATGQLEYLDNLAINFLEGDILDQEIVNRAVAGQDGVVHLAAQTGVSGSLRNPRKDCEVNVLGVLNLLEACRSEMDQRARVPDGAGTSLKSSLRGLRVVFASSNAPLGRQKPPATEEKAPLPVSPYGASKLAGEAYCLAYYGSWQLETLVLRFGNVYGPFSSHKNSVVAKFFKDILAMGQLVLDGDGEQTRDLIYVGDLCEAIVSALESKVSGEVFQIATGVETTIRSLASLVQQTAKRDVGILQGPPRRGDVHRNYSCIQKAKSHLHWEPRVNLHLGLQMTWEWFRSYRTDRTEIDATGRQIPIRISTSD
jgi:UDP-glucose 4-epimerase